MGLLELDSSEGKAPGLGLPSILVTFAPAFSCCQCSTLSEPEHLGPVEPGFGGKGNTRVVGNAGGSLLSNMGSPNE
jgi:hypothetical protein